MSAPQIPPELLEVRQRIDEVDAHLVSLLSERFALTHRVGQLKARDGLSVVDPQRESEKLQTLRSMSVEQGLNPDLVEGLFAAIMAEAVRNHRRLKGES